MKNGIIKFLQRFAVLLLVFVSLDLLFSVINRNNIYPFTERTMINFKFFDVRKKMQPKMISVGSSISLINLDSKTLVDSLGEERYYNFAAFGTSIHETLNLSKILVFTYDLDTVILSSSVVDFRSGKGVYSISKNTLGIKWYLKNRILSPLSSLMMFKCLRKDYLGEFLKDVEKNKGTIDNLVTDYYGGISQNLQRSEVSKNAVKLPGLDVDESQYGYLEKLAEFFEGKKIRFVFVQSPLSPEYYEANSNAFDGHFSRCREIIERHGGFYIDGMSHADYDYDVDFYDSGHMNKSGAEKYTAQIAEFMLDNGWGTK